CGDPQEATFGKCRTSRIRKAPDVSHRRRRTRPNGTQPGSLSLPGAQLPWALGGRKLPGEWTRRSPDAPAGFSGQWRRKVPPMPALGSDQRKRRGPPLVPRFGVDFRGPIVLFDCRTPFRDEETELKELRSGCDRSLGVVRRMTAEPGEAWLREGAVPAAPAQRPGSPRQSLAKVWARIELSGHRGQETFHMLSPLSRPMNRWNNGGGRVVRHATRCRALRWAWLMAVPLALGACSQLVDLSDPSESRPRLSSTAADVSEQDAPFPNLGSVPGEPPVVTAPEARREIMEGLIADRANAEYTRERLTAEDAAPARREEPLPEIFSVGPAAGVSGAPA